MVNVAVLFGGISTEHDVSCKSADNVIKALDREHFNPVLIGITHDGAWLHYTGDPAELTEDSWQGHDCAPVTLAPGRSGGRHGLVEMTAHGAQLMDIDVAFPVLHGQGGEDGTVQGVLETCGIPYVGCGVMASAVCMDKDASHRLAAAAGVRSPKCAVLYRNAQGTASQEDIDAALELCGGYPVFVKPARGGSSIGVSKAADAEALAMALAQAFALDEKVAVEEAITGIEVGCAVIGDAVHGIEMGAVDEIVVGDAGMFAIHLEKDPSANTQLRCPAELPEDQLDKIRAAGAAVYEALGCSGFARVDLFVTPEGEVVFNEVNSTPGMTYYSRFPQMMREAGRDFTSVLTQLIDTELMRANA